MELFSMGENYESIEDAIGEIASALRAFQCSPPGGASYPLEAYVNVHFDESSTRTLESIADAINNLASEIKLGRY
jgi:septation ring formation regulator EzrA